MNKPKPTPKPIETTKLAPPRMTRVRAGVRAGSLSAYLSEVSGEKQGSFKGG